MSALAKAKGIAYFGSQILAEALERGLDWLEAWHARQPRDSRPAPGGIRNDSTWHAGHNHDRTPPRYAAGGYVAPHSGDGVPFIIDAEECLLDRDGHCRRGHACPQEPA